MIILAATKGRTPEQINKVIKDGIKVIGESRVQELLTKLPDLPKQIRIDFIGHLQTNKVKKIIKICHLIHSVDSLKLAEIINEEARKIDKIQKILLELNIADEQTKFGFKENKLIKVFPRLLQMKNLEISGLMTMAPYFEDKEMVRPIYRQLRQLRDLLEKQFNISLPHLSMGMSNDYQIAIEEGATIIRLGRIIFD
ncbi:YggS family pyridoxal phosphate-dependent enzyme [Candidatus Roizmanbacteria bacterium CG22_combo_CG10-13_8_21_14_all_35_9]|uniref:YggS family pyridoxal phosphate-dependent enzyme n=2 Tax=Candidatus Roizmaniibacteriota TaxID=1752723 RepID=A0A2H0BZ88_9BACT|nr:MAG: YggS family pyridoxal phosphate-dependent enzyme [Candidatus Roizmanbacteria bacterium CG22_combo_CG10-13_8_21_14_all_35_9]PIY71415.1 MAG: YggS family pyridoxal phosphate-dependent enzyme [Candidatus Roizmanbacteria bacterium CG_4_10_14_0_8_um_filter_35_28]